MVATASKLAVTRGIFKHLIVASCCQGLEALKPCASQSIVCLLLPRHQLFLILGNITTNFLFKSTVLYRLDYPDIGNSFMVLFLLSQNDSTLGDFCEFVKYGGTQ